MFKIYIVAFTLVWICSLPIWKLSEIILKKYTNINTNLVWVQVLIDIPAIIIGYNAAYYLVSVYANYLGIK
ncbi:hypothetical protein [Clostridium beijerinckii]|uniref:hypothetical protein n=1 Tax=Clostridium beijerinckii TaxID=1520 RepID=UPI00156FF376|nr:hypothetical protein [Clostridium beijerinckii]NRU52386.1 hypothetical protein [Clostridium beijerinckii]NRU52685.1 hypothetical protein [Clostridium beijerinckii]NYC68728.1 hypothetical protein [Clostridium beijerinckii]NYC91877.1 hypothetical protein [Clostridium beijerinckii]